MATTLERIMDLSPDVQDYRDAMAARVGNQPVQQSDLLGSPDLSAVREVNARVNGENSAWLEGFRKYLLYPDGICSEDLSHLNNDQMLTLLRELEVNKTADVTFDRLNRANLITQLSLF